MYTICDTYMYLKKIQSFDTCNDVVNCMVDVSYGFTNWLIFVYVIQIWFFLIAWVLKISQWEVSTRFLFVFHCSCFVRMKPEKRFYGRSWLVSRGHLYPSSCCCMWFSMKQQNIEWDRLFLVECFLTTVGCHLFVIQAFCTSFGKNTFAAITNFLNWMLVYICVTPLHSVFAKIWVFCGRQNFHVRRHEPHDFAQIFAEIAPCTKIFCGVGSNFFLVVQKSFLCDKNFVQMLHKVQTVFRSVGRKVRFCINVSV